jgi:hypothetical protein
LKRRRDPFGITEARLRADAWATISNPAFWNSYPCRMRCSEIPPEECSQCDIASLVPIDVDYEGPSATAYWDKSFTAKCCGEKEFNGVRSGTSIHATINTLWVECQDAHGIDVEHDCAYGYLYAGERWGSGFADGFAELVVAGCPEGYLARSSTACWLPSACCYGLPEDNECPENPGGTWSGACLPN